MEDTLIKKRLLWGLLLAWGPWVPTLIAFRYMFVGINNSKATGLAVVVGGMVELLVWWGIATMIISQVAAIVWLVRSFSGIHVLRSLVAAVSLCASGLMRFLLFAFLYWGRHFLEQGTSR